MQTKIFKVIHLDDHKIITDGIGKLLVNSISGCSYKSFNDTDAALKYTVKLIENNQTVDLLITDFIHPGLDGYQFAKVIRQWEKKWQRQPISILLLTMVDGNVPIIQQGLKKRIFDNYIALTTSEPLLVNLIKTVIFQ